MVCVEVVCVPGHTTHVETLYISGKHEAVLRAICRCGWKSPGYPQNDIETAVVGGLAHTRNARPLPPHHVVTLR